MQRSQLASLLYVVSQAAGELGIVQKNVTTVVGTQDQDIAQMKYLLAAVAQEIMDEEPYDTILGDGRWVIDIDTNGYKTTFDKDTDMIAFDRRLAINGLKWRFLKAKGLDYGEEQRDFTTTLNKIAAQASTKVLDLDLDASVVQ